MDAPTLESFVQAVPLPTVVIRSDERIEAANTEARRLFGSSIDQRHFITVFRQPELLDAIDASLRDMTERRARYVTNNGRHDLTYEVTMRPVQLPRSGGLLVCFEDVSQREKVGQMRRDFVANVSHELRTPLTAVIGFIETIKGPARDDAKARDRFLNIMETETGRMNRLVDDLLSLSRVEADERVRPREVVLLPSLVRSVGRSFESLAKDAQAEIAFDLPKEDFELLGDPDQLRQVFSNLIENAIKYGGAGTVVTVSVSEPTYDARVRAVGTTVRVSDTGPGIDPIHIPRLTERFYRIDNHRSREMGGTGLGLAIVKHIVNRHRGRMRVESEKGRGSSFVITLPVE